MTDMFRMYEKYSKKIKFAELRDPAESWELQDLIGEGTYGEVYSARNKHTGNWAAVKVLESIHEVIEEIEEEYTILLDFNDHPNMPRFYDLCLKKGEMGTEDQVWIVMELCSRGSVTDLSKALIEQNESMGEVLIAHVLKETLKVLHFLHKNHVIHRDIKGHNILMTEEGNIKLVDFGVSSHMDRTLGKRKTSVGTPYWMAPETGNSWKIGTCTEETMGQDGVIACERQLEYKYDIRCDVWSVGITAIELADGEPPLADKHPMRALFRIPRNPPPKLKSPEKWSATFKDFIAKCLVKDFEARPFSWELLDHPFIKQVPHDTSHLKEKLIALTAQMERIIHEPDVTAKQGRLKSHRKSRKEPLQTVDDLAMLEVLDEEAIVTQLHSRYDQGTIYTYIGDILLAVNPFTPLTVYGEQHAKMYMNAAKGDNPPHIFAVADQAYQMMMHNKKHQCIVISGESGAGKTESANFLVQQLTLLGKAPNRTLEERILQVNPLMEAFGNAKTVINDNSSRFGKYLEMFYTGNGTVVGAKITEYLLEKSRVISQASGEQNFHIFYYVHDGLSTEDKNQAYHLKKRQKYSYIAQHTSKTPDVSTVSVNRVKFKAIQHCFDIIGFKPEEVSSVYGIIAAILHIGNIEFKEKQSEVHAGDACSVADMDLVDLSCELLGLEARDIVEVLTTTGMVARGEVIIRENSVPEAIDARDAMAKALYGRLFSWIVNRINVLFKPEQAKDSPQDDYAIIGLLDIFGFENFPQNSFEQLCINIANEQIQYYFNQHIFAWELQEYKNEGVDGSNVTFVDNRNLLDMFLMKPLGLLALLDEESHFPKATDQTLVDKFHQNIKSSYYSRPKGNNLMFCIDHYAGAVLYDAVGFLEKNRDRLPVELVNVLRSSNNKVVQSLFQTPLTKTGNLAEGSWASKHTSGQSSTVTSHGSTGGISIKSFGVKSNASSGMGGSKGSASASMTRVQQTVATYFRFSLMDLLAKMVAGSPHFVRCIRPNEEKLPDQFDMKKVKTQLKYTGVLETTRIRREGYSHRIPFMEFMKRYSVLSFRPDKPVQYDKVGSQELLEMLGLKGWALGNTKVFLKYYHVEQLTRQYETLLKKIVRIQSLIRMFITRNKFFEMKWKREKAVICIQAWVRGWLARRRYGPQRTRRKRAAIVIQKCIRGLLTRKRTRPLFNRRQKAAVTIQAVYRGHQSRKRVKQIRHSKEEKSAQFIQNEDTAQHRQKEVTVAYFSCYSNFAEYLELLFYLSGAVFRSHRAKKIAKQLMQENDSRLNATIVLQTYFRMWRCKTVYQQLLRYREQKEIQLIYFGQQVDQYNKDMLTTLEQTNVPIPSFTSQNSKQQPSLSVPLEPHVEVVRTTPPQKASPEKKKKSAPKPPQPPDVSEERLEHMKKMRQVKLLMPESEGSYYDELQEQKADDSESPPDSPTRTSPDEFVVPPGQVIDWDKPLEEAKQVSLSVTFAEDTSPPTPLSPPMGISPLNYLSTQSLNTDYLNFPYSNESHNSDSYSTQFLQDPTSPQLDDLVQQRLARIIAEAILANRPKESHPTISESHSSISWDAPLHYAFRTVQAMKSVLGLRSHTPEAVTSSLLGSKVRSQGPVPPIELDFKSEKSDLYKETTTQDLVYHLQQEHSDSFHGKWLQRHQEDSSGEASPRSVSSENQSQNASSRNFKSTTDFKRFYTSSNNVDRQVVPELNLSFSNNSSPNQSPRNRTDMHPPGQLSWQHVPRPPTPPRHSKKAHQNGSLNKMNGDIGDSNSYDGKKVKFSPGQPTIIIVQHRKPKEILKYSDTSSTNTPVDHRTNLRKTNIDLTKSIKRMDRDGEVPVFNFRALLKKTGRLNVEEPEQ